MWEGVWEGVNQVPKEGAMGLDGMRQERVPAIFAAIMSCHIGTSNTANPIFSSDQASLLIQLVYGVQGNCELIHPP